MIKTEEHFEIKKEDEGISVLSVLCSRLKFGEELISNAIHKGAIWFTRSGKTRAIKRPGFKLKTGDELHAYIDENLLVSQPPPIECYFSSEDYSVWFKPAGLPSQGSKWCDHLSMEGAVRASCEYEIKLVHRLDKATSGLMLFAHTKKAARAFSEYFERAKIEKRYLVKVRGNFQEYQGEKDIATPLDGKPARTLVSLIKYVPQEDISLLEVSIKTGRKHQIRRHLSSIGYSLVGDRLYAGDDSMDLQLQAYYLAFTCPVTGEPLKFILPEKDRLFSGNC